jgi:hypothetical protein
MVFATDCGIGVFATFKIPKEGADVQRHVDEEGSEEAKEEALRPPIPLGRGWPFRIR